MGRGSRGTSFRTRHSEVVSVDRLHVWEPDQKTVGTARPQLCTRGTAPCHMLWATFLKPLKVSSGSPPGAPCAISPALHPPPPGALPVSGARSPPNARWHAGTLSQDAASLSHASGSRGVDSTPETTALSCSWDTEHDPLRNLDSTTRHLLVPRSLLTARGHLPCARHLWSRSRGTCDVGLATGDRSYGRVAWGLPVVVSADSRAAQAPYVASCGEASSPPLAQVP